MTQTWWPEFPSVIDAGDATEADKQRIAAAAWEQSGGSITAYEELVAEHFAGQINLLPPAPVDPGPPAPAGEPLTEIEEDRLAELRAKTDPLSLAEIAEMDALAAREGV